MPTWVTITSQSICIGNGTIVYSVSTNISGNSRTGTLTIAGQIFTITQMGRQRNPDTTGVFRPSTGELFMKNQNTTGFADLVLNYGLPGDKPVVGDWDGDGITTLGVYRNGRFYLRNSNTVGFAEIIFDLGIPGDEPISGHWDGLP